MKSLLPALLACAVSQVNAQQIASPVSSIRVTADSIVTAKPERAQIDVGVLTQEKQSQNAATQNAKQIDGVLTALHKLLGPDADSFHQNNMHLDLACHGKMCVTRLCE